MPATLRVPVAGWPKKRELGPLSSGQGKSMQFVDPDRIEQSDRVQAASFAPNHLNLSQRPPNKVLQDQTPSVSPAELLLSRETRRTLAQLRTNKSPLLVSYLFSIGDPRHPSPLCPLCLMHDHTSSHLFECKSLPTSLSSLDLWTNPDKVEPFLAKWGERLLAATWFGC